MTEWVSSELGSDMLLHFSAFHPDWKMRDKPRTRLQTLQKARSIAIMNGLDYVYTGNVHDQEDDTTYCYECGEKLIIRDWYEIKTWSLKEASGCSRCNTVCAGIFDVDHGKRNSKRVPVKLANTT